MKRLANNVKLTLLLILHEPVFFLLFKTFENRNAFFYDNNVSHVSQCKISFKEVV